MPRENARSPVVASEFLCLAVTLRCRERTRAASLAPSTMTETLPEGAVVAGRLRVVRTLGAGGMGAVYEVEHLITKHRRALKLLHAEVAGMPGVVERFLREASAAGRVGNPHVVETFDAGTTEQGEPYIVMELLKGRSLADRLVERGFFDVVFCSIEIAGERPSIWSTSGFCIISRNCRA